MTEVTKAKHSPQSHPPSAFQEKGPPVVEEGTDDFGPDWVELQVRDVVEVLLPGFPRTLCSVFPGAVQRFQAPL